MNLVTSNQVCEIGAWNVLSLTSIKYIKRTKNIKPCLVFTISTNQRKF